MSLKFRYFAPPKKRNIPQNQPSTYLNIAHNYLSVVKTEELFVFACEALEIV